MKSFIDEHRDQYGVEPICRVLPIAPSTCFAHADKKTDADLRSDRAKRDEGLSVEIRRVFDENFRVYGIRKVWRQMKREGFDIARCTSMHHFSLLCRTKIGNFTAAKPRYPNLILTYATWQIGS